MILRFGANETPLGTINRFSILTCVQSKPLNWAHSSKVIENGTPSEAIASPVKLSLL